MQRQSVSLGAKAQRWAQLHSSNCVAALGELRARPLATLLTAGVIAIALTLPAALNLLVQNGRNVAGGWEGVRDFSVYMEPAADITAAEALATELRERPNIASVTVTNATQALEEFRATSGLKDVIDALDSNPLPHTLTIRPVISAPALALNALGMELGERPGVDIVRIDTEWVERLNAILDFMRRLVTGIAVMLIVGVIIIVGNTIRLDIQNRRDEIAVVKLLGGSDGFVRRPFLYLGFWYGLVGGLLALALLFIGGLLLAAPVKQLLGMYGAQTQLLGLDGVTVLAVLAGGLVAGWGGAWGAVSRHLAAIQPK
jgi:cell division transport system permease protein